MTQNTPMCNQRMCTGLRTTASRRVLARACSGPTAMALLEHLENRQLLSFGDDNVVTGPSVMDPPFIRPVEVAIGSGDKIVATGGNLIARFNADGSSDTSFGSNGVVTAALDEIFDVAVQGDGKVVVVGRLNGEFAVARYTGTGQLDATFSGDGFTNRSFGGTPGADVAHAVAIQPDGKIVAVGAGRTGRSGAATTLVIARYNADGSIDTTFDNDGYSAELLRVGNDVATDVEIAPAGKIVVGGTTGTTGVVIRYNTSGSFDTGFSGDGVAYLDEEHGDAPGSVRAIAVQSDGKVVWAGGTVIPHEDRFVPYAIVGRLNANGTEDDAFSLGGTTYLQGVFRDDQTTASFAHDLTLDDHGNIVVVGQEEQDDGATSLSAITVLKPDGAVHPEYDDENDFDYLPFDSRSAAEGVAIQSDGDIIVAGEEESTTMMLARVGGVDDGGGTPGGGDGTGLTGTYYSNIDFTGSSITRTDAAVNFDWGSGGPSGTIGTDTFSARWTGQVEAQKTEQYTFYTNTDDGVRLWVNGQLLVNMWVPQGETEWSGTVDLVAGQKYDIKMEYFERYGSAVAELRWSSPSTPKQLVPTSQLFPSGTGTPADTQEPTTPPNLNATADHERVILDWDASTDNVGVVSYEIRRNDVRIATVGASQTTYTDTDVHPNNGYGYDVIAIDAAGNRSDEAFVNIMTPPAPPHVGQGLQGVYYSNIDFTGSTITRTDSNINFNWGSGGPSSTIGTDTFSVRWTGQILAEKTEGYVFHTRTDDGVRLWVDGQLIIDQWVPQSATEHSGSIDLVAGRKYDIKMEYFERYGSALAELRWSSATTPKQIVPESHLFAEGTGTPTDTQKPTMPGSLSSQSTDDQVTLDWEPSTDNVGVVSYEIRRDQSRIATLPASQTDFTDDTVGSSTVYGYEVIAIDAAGNRSDPAFALVETPNPPTGSGLQMLLYDNMDFTDLTKARIVPKVDLDWGRGSPDTEIDPDTFSVRFYGHVKPEKTERYTFYTNSDDGVRLTVNGQVLIDKLVPQSETEWSGSIELEAGKEYDIQLDYIERFGDAVVQLFWSSPTTPKQIIPAANLEPGAFQLD